MRTETRTVPKLEFVPLPDAATAPCLVSLPPLDSSGSLPYEELPAYTARVLGTLEECNEKLEAIRKLQPVPAESSGQVMKGFVHEVRPTEFYEAKPMVVVVYGYDNHSAMHAGFNKRTANQYVKTTPKLQAVSLRYTLNGLRYCELFVVRPKLYSDTEWGSWGHELGHCAYGEWHPKVGWD